ncbi:MAG: hypothetical protein HQK49_08090 [Oligoflexia bacterium]|nr:hypothetical protein [Oligoflexia bacterium]
MRLWSIHPKYLDTKGLLAVWREGLLAKKVLEGNTKGYKNHSQLIRFKKNKNPIKAICAYLTEILIESKKRGYNFDESKINVEKSKMFVTSGQLAFEQKHLLKKLYTRNKKKYLELDRITKLEAHPMFKIRPGDIEDFEVIKDYF